MSDGFGAGTRWAEGLEQLRPVLEAEIARGNRGDLTQPELRDSRQAWQFRFQLDVAALNAEFEFSEGVRALGGPADSGRIEFTGRSGTLAFVITGGDRRSWRVKRRRAAWWGGVARAPGGAARGEQSLLRTERMRHRRCL